MIKFENTDVMNFRGAIRGLRNPMNSWNKSDSKTCADLDCWDCPQHLKAKSEGKYEDCGAIPEYEIVEIGDNDLALMKRLIKSGSDHRKFMRQIIVSVDITAPLYWWKEFDTYKVGTVANSCSTMHKIHAKEFTLEDFSYEHLSDFSLQIILEKTIEALNHYRNEYLKSKDKFNWWQLIQLLPSSYNQKRTVTLNYETLYNIYGSRKNHKLDEWRVGFINWIESLPYAKELIVDRS